MAETCKPAPETGRPKTRVSLKIEEWLAGAAIAVLALLTFANVVVRYATDFSFAFTEEFSIFLMVLMTLLGASSVMAKNGHLNISYFIDRLSPRGRRWVRLAATAAVVVTFALLAALGGVMAYDEYRYEVTSPGLGIPTWIYTVWLPILSLAIMGRTIGLFIRIRRGQD